MSAKRAGKRSGTTDWRHHEHRTELMKAIGAAAGVVVLTALIVFLIKPGGSSTSTDTPVQQTPVTTPTGSTPPGSTVPGGSTDTSTPAATTPAETTPPDTSAPSSSTPAGSTPTP